MGYEQLMYLHLVTVLPCFLLGTVLLLIKKGTFVHKKMGQVYMILMLITAVITLGMQAEVGPRFLNHFGYLHLFSVLTLYTVPTAYWAIKRGDVKAHRRKMIILYFGAIILAGGFTFVPGRHLHQFFFG